jgi:hypothetical protein
MLILWGPFFMLGAETVMDTVPSNVSAASTQGTMSAQVVTIEVIIFMGHRLSERRRSAQ